MKKFVDGGGTLVVDAAGGNTEFAAAAETELKAVFPALPDVLPEDHGVYSAGAKLTTAAFRRFGRIRLGENKGLRLRGLDVAGHTRVFYSPEDLTEGMVGEPVDGVYGYTPEVATQLMANIACYAAGITAPPPAPTPAPKPKKK